MTLAAVLTMLWTTASAASDSIRNAFTEEHPLVYEGAWDLWPYSFLNENGEPVGYNIDLLKLILNELNIPYRIKLKPKTEALADLKAGRADLMCTMGAHYHDEYAQFSKNVIQIFTASILHHKDEPPVVKTIGDLATQQVIVHNNSFSHHLMMDRGWEKNAIPYNDMQEALQYVHSHKGSQILWNTLSLKWLLLKFGYDDLVITPVNIPHGEYKFLSNNEQLLKQIDSVFAMLNSTGRLQPLQNKWLYPEHKDSGIPSWVWSVVAALAVVIVLFLIYYVSYRHYEQKMTTAVKHSNNRLSLILQTSKVRIWLFDVRKRSFTSIDPGGKKSTFPLSANIIQSFVVPEDFDRLIKLLDEMAEGKKERETIELHVLRSGNTEVHIYSIDISVMKRDKSNRPTVMIGASTDITAARQRQQQQKDTMLRYQHIFNSAIIDTVSYDEHGFIDGLNEKAVKGIGGDVQRVIDAHIPVQSVLGEPDLSLDDLDYTYLTQIYRSPNDKRVLNRFLRRKELYYELQLVPIRDDDGRLLGIFGSGRDVTDTAKSYSQLLKNTARLQEATNELQDYIRNMDYVMKNGGVRVVNYSPDTHTLTIYSDTEHVQHRLTQTRLLTLAAEESKKTAQRIMNNMDNLTGQPVKAVVKSTLRDEGHPIYLAFSFVPVKDAEGHINEYFGMCRDISDIKATEELLAKETRKAQEVEMVKNAFLHNMCNEIRTPLNAVVNLVDLVEKNQDGSDGQRYIENIKKHSRNLLNLVNNILFLSRLDAGMIESKTTTVDFAAFFEECCKTAWASGQQPGVEYIVETPYDQLMLDIDLSNLSIAIDQVIANAVQHTTSGYVRAHFDYNGEDLTVAIQDTGCGIPADQQEKIFERFVTTNSGSSGIGLSICQQVVKLMGGRIHLKSEEGKGTIFWIIIPCKEKSE